MKLKKEIIGIDVSKLTLDVFILSLKHHFVVSNNPLGFSKLLQVIWEKLPNKKESLFFCFEDTGKYSLSLCIFLNGEKLSYAMVPALDIKRSMGMVRGKSDKKDASVIALYAWRKRDEIKPTVFPAGSIVRIKQLLSLRNKLVKHKKAYQTGMSDVHDYFKDGDSQFYLDVNKRVIKSLCSEITSIEKEIETQIKSDPEVQNNYKILKTVPGIGKIIAFYMIAYTHNFTKFENARKFCCYCGIAPFENTSGTSLKGRTKVNHLANKMIKALLNMGALSVIQNYPEFKSYYNQRVEKGHNKMSTVNIIRNKIVFRAFSVIKRGSPYINLHKFAA
ncbi:MAG: IS110 family transposase [Bacteroidales bacterium]